MIKENLHFMDRIFRQIGKFLKEEIEIETNVVLTLTNKFGNSRVVAEFHNTVPALGKGGIMDQLLASPSIAKPGWVELGTGSPSATKLGSYLAGSRVALLTKTRADNIITMTASFGPGVGTGALTEIGLFNSAVEDSGLMFASASFGVVTKPAEDTLGVTWTMTATL